MLPDGNGGSDQECGLRQEQNGSWMQDRRALCGYQHTARPGAATLENQVSDPLHHGTEGPVSATHQWKVTGGPAKILKQEEPASNQDPNVVQATGI